MRKRIIIYGIGKEFKTQRNYLESQFQIVGVSDLRKKDVNNFIEPKDIIKYNFDYIYITSLKFFDEIKMQLIGLGIAKEKIISVKDVFGDFRNSQIRHEWVKNKLSQIEKGKVLLDAGAGEMRYKPYCKHLKYIAQDFGQYIPSEAAGLHPDAWDTSIVDIVSDIINIPIEDKYVDVVLCTEVFEHLKDPMLALKEFSRIIKPGGTLILTAPFCCLTHMAPYFYYNGFSEFWYKEYLGQFDFQIVELTKNGNYFKFLCQELFRVSDMANRYCMEELELEEIETLCDTIKILTHLSEKDCGSAETLCFGYMLEAKKV